MPKPSEEAREARRTAEERLRTAYGFPDRYSRPLSPRGAIAVILWAVVLFALVARWSGII